MNFVMASFALLLSLSLPSVLAGQSRIIDSKTHSLTLPDSLRSKINSATSRLGKTNLVIPIFKKYEEMIQGAYQDDFPGIPMAVIRDFTGDGKDDMLIAGGIDRKWAIVLVDDHEGSAKVQVLENVFGDQPPLFKAPYPVMLTYVGPEKIKFHSGFSPRTVFQIEMPPSIGSSKAYLIENGKIHPAGPGTFQFQ